MLIRILSEFKDIVILERGLRASCNSFMWRMVSRKSVHLFKDKLASTNWLLLLLSLFFVFKVFYSLPTTGSGRPTKIDDCCI